MSKLPATFYPFIVRIHSKQKSASLKLSIKTEEKCRYTFCQTSMMELFYKGSQRLLTGTISALKIHERYLAGFLKRHCGKLSIILSFALSLWLLSHWQWKYFAHHLALLFILTNLKWYQKKVGIKPLITVDNVSFQKVFDFEENGIDLDIL